MQLLTLSSFLFTVIFLPAAPLLILIGHTCGKTRGVMLSGVGFVLVCWFLIAILTLTHGAELSMRIESTSNPSPELMEAVSKSGGIKTWVAFNFGWLYGVIYHAIWLIPYALCRLIGLLASPEDRQQPPPSTSITS